MEFHDGQIFVDFVICPYCSLGEESTYILPLLTPLLLKFRMKDGHIPPDSLTCPCGNYEQMALALSMNFLNSAIL